MLRSMVRLLSPGPPVGSSGSAAGSPDTPPALHPLLSLLCVSGYHPAKAKTQTLTGGEGTLEILGFYSVPFCFLFNQENIKSQVA